MAERLEFMAARLETRRVRWRPVVRRWQGLPASFELFSIPGGPG
jgi:hypothetical protein